MGFRDRFPSPDEFDPAQKRARLLGFVVVYLGSQFLLGIVLIAWFTIPKMFGGGAEGDGALFTGSKLDRWLVLFVYANAAMIGLTITAAGLFQALSGQRAQPIFVRLIMLFMALASLAVTGLGR